MTTHIASSRAPNLGPFLTLLVLTASHHTKASRDWVANSETARVKITGEQAEVNGRSPNPANGTVALGPFLTLILTLHRRKGSTSGGRPRACVAWHPAPVVRIRAAG
jgi:hypothetical protein